MSSAGGFTLRRGDGGGKRVSAATRDADPMDIDIDGAEAAMAALGQAPLFMIRGPEDRDLDDLLASRGYAVIDPVTIYTAPVDSLSGDLPRLAAFAIWEPLAIQAEIWAESAIGPARLAVMERATGPKTSLLGRSEGRAAATAFVACDGDVAMVHALEVRPRARRRGVGRHMMCAAANWARAHGARVLALAVTQANAPANALYLSLGMSVSDRYHYRMAP